MVRPTLLVLALVRGPQAWAKDPYALIQALRETGSGLHMKSPNLENQATIFRSVPGGLNPKPKAPARLKFQNLTKRLLWEDGGLPCRSIRSEFSMRFKPKPKLFFRVSWTPKVGKPMTQKHLRIAQKAFLLILLGV